MEKNERIQVHTKKKLVLDSLKKKETMPLRTERCNRLHQTQDSVHAANKGLITDSKLWNKHINLFVELNKKTAEKNSEVRTAKNI